MQRLHRRLGMTDAEYDAVIAELGREPTDLELAMYSVMWSEHCSYKSSRRYLRRLPTEAPWVLVGPGEGAGVVDVGDGIGVAVRIESHNHPSAVEPYQGAATGVGGIIRDIFSMGARPIALMDPLRFGDLSDPRTRYLFEGVVAGISGYGNAVGVPTVGGEVVFDDAYRGNPLVNVLCLGVLPKERLVLARAEGEGNLAVLLGASTGRDGIGGASVLASAGFVEGSEQKRPSVQVGDPFEEKKLIEACLALLDAGLAVGVQDLGAAGLSCAASETAAKGGVGMDVDVARVAHREPGMTPVEIMTSESQERMLAIVRPEDLDEVVALCDRWEIAASVVGRVTGTGRFRVYEGLFDAAGVPGANPPPAAGDASPPTSSDAAPLADVPAGSLGDGPDYDRPLARPADHERRAADDPWLPLRSRFPAGSDLSAELLALLATPTIADKSWISRQYDHQLFLNTVVGPGGDAAVLRIKGTRNALALSTDCNSRYCALEPAAGARLAVLEAARNVSCSGARPIALVNCLNFGNPEHAEVMWQFSEVVEAMSDACRSLRVPVIGGNVSFYNESHGADIPPTPVVGVIGLIEDLTATPPPVGLEPGRRILVLGATAAELGGSEWAARHGLVNGRPPAADLDAGAALHDVVRALVADRAVSAVHDCAEGGLAVALAEMAVRGGVGFRVGMRRAPGEPEVAAACFSESASRVVVAVEPARVDEVVTRARDGGVPAAEIGGSGGDRLVADGAFDVALSDATRAYCDAIPNALGGRLDSSAASASSGTVRSP
ncbi:MAG: phosphoribosylformylglycinamidine synthase subunit PurL [Actinobacteria bacterium]|nr:phosphoribosylformylglycinamidine synthase subunit PurL [Actinomycetota bacterium]